MGEWACAENAFLSMPRSQLLECCCSWALQNSFLSNKPSNPAGVREAGYTELPPEEAPHRLVLDGRRLAPTQENLERYLHNLLKRLQVSA